MTKKIISAEAMAAAQRSEDFWSTIDGDKLAKVGLLDKDMDLVGPATKVHPRVVVRKGNMVRISGVKRATLVYKGTNMAKRLKLKVG